MKQSYFTDAKKIFPGSDAVRKYTFKTMDIRDSYAYLARANHQLAHDFSVLRDKSAHFQKNDCFECLSPYIKAV